VDAGAGCPAQVPADGTACTMNQTCVYPNASCDCAGGGRRDGGRQWNCTTLGGPDGQACPVAPVMDGTPCTIPGATCSDGMGGTCDCMGGMWGC
jgi:hypothetical protein